MRKNFFGSIVLAAALAGGAFIAIPQTASAGVLAHQVKTQGELGSVFINPYDVAPLTAVIDRAGKDIKDIHVRVLGKPNGGIDIAYHVSEHALLTHDGVPIWGLYFGDEARKIDLNYVIRQEGRRTDANMQVRGALLDRSVKTFRGTLDFIQGARGSVGKEDEEVMLFSPHVRNRSVPLMLSHEGDVDGHHAVSIGRMDAEKLFYLMSRGLDDRAAQQLIVEASFEPVMARIESEELRAEIAGYLERRLLGGTQE
ncbi:MAG: SufD family Fe-S cluster assembly protein [Campylobacter sp.]|uniref:SufD family Fe-S cluster assembly protein n=1 Tax=Campylobacter sp. TaxID=205 RepID=UPI00360E40E7